MTLLGPVRAMGLSLTTGRGTTVRKMSLNKYQASLFVVLSKRAAILLALPRTVRIIMVIFASPALGKALPVQLWTAQGNAGQELGAADAKSPSCWPGWRGRWGDGAAQGLQCPGSAAGPAVPCRCHSVVLGWRFVGLRGPRGLATGWGCRSSPLWASPTRGPILCAGSRRPRWRGWASSRVTLPVPSRWGVWRGGCQPGRSSPCSRSQGTCVGLLATARSHRAKAGSALRALALSRTSAPPA